MLLIPLVILLILYFMYCLLMRYESENFMGVGFFGLSLLLLPSFMPSIIQKLITKYPLLMDIGVY